MTRQNLLACMVVRRGGADDAVEAPSVSIENSILRVKLEAAEQALEERDRELRHREETISDLRDRLDREGEERRKLTAMLTDQRTPPKGFWARLRRG